jgi:hypothetical protein
MLGFLICFLMAVAWGVIGIIVVLLVEMLLNWALSLFGGPQVPAEVWRLMKALVALLVVIEIIGCLAGFHVFPPLALR